MENPTWDELYEHGLERGMTDSQARQYADTTLQQMDDIMIGDVARAVTTKLLRQIHRRSVELDYNRTWRKGVLFDLHPDGIHLVRPMMIHRHRAGEEVAPHVRTEVMLRWQSNRWNDGDRGRGMLDMTIDDFISLPSVQQIKEQWQNGLDATMPDGTVLPPPDYEVSDDIHGPDALIR